MIYRLTSIKTGPGHLYKFWQYVYQCQCTKGIPEKPVQNCAEKFMFRTKCRAVALRWNEDLWLN